MPWKVKCLMDERLRFIARLLKGEAMTDLCVEFGISRKTGYQIYDRYRQSGAEALNDRSRRPNGYVEAQIVGLKNDKSHWGCQKDQGTADPQTAIRDQSALTLHHPCCPQPQRLGQAPGAQAQQGARLSSLSGHTSQ